MTSCRGEYRNAPSWVETIAEEIVESNLPLRSWYEWVDTKVTEYFSKYQWSSLVESYATSASMLTKDVEEGVIALEWSLTIYVMAEWVMSLIFLYVCLFVNRCSCSITIQ